VTFRHRRSTTPRFPSLPTDHAFERRDLRLVVLKQIQPTGLTIERSSFKLPHADSKRLLHEIVSAGESMQRLACSEVLGDLPFELDAALGHGFIL
jgi:hypothetical protein